MGKKPSLNKHRHAPSLLEQAIAAQSRQHWEEAASLYERHLANQPQDVVALANLAATQRQLGRHQAALANFALALKSAPQRWDIWFNQANAQKAMGLPESAEDSYREAVGLEPTFHQGWFNLGILLRDLGRWAEAAESFSRALSLASGTPSYHFQLGQALVWLERRDEAIKTFYRVLELEPGHPAATLALASLLKHAQRTQGAEDVIKQALSLRPDDQQLLRFLYVLLLESGRAEDALASIQRLRTGLPDDLGLMSDEGVALQKLGRMREAEDIWSRAAALTSSMPDPLCNLGALYQLQKKYEQAVASLERALAIDPHHLQANANLADIMTRTGRPSRVMPLAHKMIEVNPDSSQGYLVMGNALTSQARIPEALEAFAQARQRAPQDRIPVANSLFSLLYSDRHGPREIADIHRSLAAAIKPAMPDLGSRLKNRSPESRRPLRVGYLSTDFGEHPVGYLMRPILKHHDPQRVTAICYADVLELDQTGSELKSLAAHWVDCHGWPDQWLVERILEDEVDVLVDLNGHTAGGRTSVTASHPAHVTVVFLGYPYAMGLPGLDWFLADRYLVPPDKSSLYPDPVETIGRCFFSFQPYSNSPPVASPPALKKGYVTFGSFNNLPKLSDSALDLWAEVLREVPRSRLILKALQFQDEETQGLIRAKFHERSIYSSRLALHGPSRPLSAYLSSYAEVDIALDPLPFNGGMTTLDALWMGVPVVSLAGELSFSRMGLSILATAGLPEWAASTREEYVSLAAGLARDLPRLAEMRAAMRGKLLASRLCDGAGYVRELEEAYWRMAGREAPLPA